MTDTPHPLTARVAEATRDLSDNLRRLYEAAIPAMQDEIAERMRPMKARAIDAGLLDATPTPSCTHLTGRCDVRGCEPLRPAGLVEPPAPVTVPSDG